MQLSSYRVPHILLAAAFIVGHSAAAAVPATPEQASRAREPTPNLMPDIEEVALATERQILATFLRETMSGKYADPEAGLPLVDATLAKLAEPTKLRGVLQFIRAQTLSWLSRHGEAVEPIQESIRLLPGYSGPLIEAANIYAFNNQPGMAADYLIRASRIDPVTVRTIDDYDVGNIQRRLRAAGDERRLRALSDRLLEINWIGEMVGSQSGHALAAIRQRAGDGDVNGAQALIPRLLLPEHARSLLINARYTPLWPQIERWSGLRFEKLWRSYLTEARDRWKASGTLLAARDYTDALRSAGHHKTVVREILPIFYRDIDARGDYDLLFLVTPVAAALAEEGRWPEVEKLFARVSRVWPLGSHAGALNPAANRVSYLLMAGETKRALELADAVIADARKWGSEVNLDALAGMHGNRACILHALGRDAEAVVSVAQALQIEKAGGAAHLHLCTGNVPAARAALLEGLKSEPDRDQVLEFMQPAAPPKSATPYQQRMHAAVEGLRSDKEILAEARKHGRILPYPLEAGAPPE